MCVAAPWQGKPQLFPSGIPPLPRQIGYTLYGPFFCPGSYDAKFAMANSSDGKNADPTGDASEAFYSALFASQQHSHMTGYEVDFLQDQTRWTPYMVTQHDGAAKWLTGMAAAAAKLNMSVQYCMAHPAAFLHALTLPAVTNGRASGDYVSPDGNLEQYGSNALFFTALGIAPSKDNWWSTAEQPKPRDLTKANPTALPPCDGGGRNVTRNFLHALVATLSTGPVGFSDALGYTNASLVLSTCRNDGLLLKPSLPLRAIDRSFSRAKPKAPVLPYTTHLWFTHTCGEAKAASAPWYYALAFASQAGGAPAGTVLLRADLWPPLPSSQAVVVWEHSNVKGAKLVGPGSKQLASMSTGGDHAYILVAPVMAGGWAFLGEAKKLTPVSVQRQFRFSFATAGAEMTVTMSGVAGELCELSAFVGGHVNTAVVTIGVDGVGTATFGGQQQQPPLSIKNDDEEGAVFTIASTVATPVIGRATAAGAGVHGGFETGNAFKDRSGTYHLIYGEKSGNTTYPWKMGWTNQIGHWTSRDGGVSWERLETVMQGASLWSTMPFFDPVSDRWKIFYCNESVGDTRTATATVAGEGSISAAQSWSFPECGRPTSDNPCPTALGPSKPSVNTYSISNPFQAAADNGNWSVFLDHGGMFKVMLATSVNKSGPFVVTNSTWSEETSGLFPLQPAACTWNATQRQPGCTNQTQERSWIENPVVTQVEGGFVAAWDFVQGGGQEAGAPLPYLGFSW